MGWKHCKAMPRSFWLDRLVAVREGEDCLLLRSSAHGKVNRAVPQRRSFRSLCCGPAFSLHLPSQPGGHPPEWCSPSQALAQDPGLLCPLFWSCCSGSLLVESLCWRGKNFCPDKALVLGTSQTI